MTMNGSDTAETQAIEEFEAMSPQEQRTEQYRATRASGSHLNELHTALGAVARELARNTKSNDRGTTALEIFTDVMQGKVAQASAPKGSSLPPMRPPVPSVLEVRDEDITAIKEFKLEAMPAVKAWAANQAVKAWVWGVVKVSAVVLGVILSAAGVGALGISCLKTALGKPATDAPASSASAAPALAPSTH